MDVPKVNKKRFEEIRMILKQKAQQKRETISINELFPSENYDEKFLEFLERMEKEETHWYCGHCNNYIPNEEIIVQPISKNKYNMVCPICGNVVDEGNRG